MSTARRDRGSVTVELAMALPAVVLVLAMVLATVSWARAGVSAADAAAWGARIAAVEGDSAAVEAVRGVMPGAQVEVAAAGDGRTVTVRVTVRTTSWLPAASSASTALVTP